ncbi:transposase [Paenibacillus borealis]|uniref:transposase n=1 Tax=Paenibacillus TaxID=44249 RepID=UPI00096C1AB3
MFYPISFRVVRFVLPNGAYETVITNLSATEFPPDEIKSIYNRRWGIETSFRALKYTVGLTNFHAKRREYITQEIFARMILYNFAEMINSHVSFPKWINGTHTKSTSRLPFTFVDTSCAHGTMNPRLMLKH